MIFITVLLAVALMASLAVNLGLIGGGPSPSRPALGGGASSSPARPERRDDDVIGRLRAAEAELEKRKKDLEEARKAHNDTREELKAAKKRLFEQKEAGRGGDDLQKARAEVERNASIQLESTRAELATALAEVQRLKAEAERGGRRPERPERREEPAARVEERPQVVVQKVIRELSDVEKERMARLETQAAQDRKKAIELERELRSVKGKVDKAHREAKRIFDEGTLARDKFRAVEKRLNRTLLESDLVRRALAILEKQTGQTAERSTLTAEEVAESDRTMTEKFAAEDKAAAEAQAKLEAEAQARLEAEEKARAEAFAAEEKARAEASAAEETARAEERARAQAAEAQASQPAPSPAAEVQAANVPTADVPAPAVPAPAEAQAEPPASA